MNKVFLLGLLFTGLFSCHKNSKNKEVAGEFSKNIKIDSIQLEEVPIPDFETSFNGSFEIYDAHIHFLDKKFGKIFQFSSEGQLVNEFLGIGDGPSEISTSFDAYLNLKNGNNLFLGSSFDLHLHKKASYEIIKKDFISWDGEQDISKVRSSTTPDVNQFALYTLDYQNLLLREGSKGQIYIPVYGETQYFNGLNSDFYYEEGKILARLDLESAEVMDVMGKRSPKYLDNKYLPHHSSFSYDLDSSNSFYVSHEIDSLIYKYNEDFELVAVFGVAGSNMDTDYTAIKEFDPKLFKELYFNERPQLGWYSYLEFIDELGLLFRSYTKGAHSEVDGLQIFEGATLIADVKVPKGFKIKGYLMPHVYGEVVEEDSEQFKLYRFTFLEERQSLM